MDFLIDGQLSSFCPDQSEAKGQKPINATKTHAIFVKLKENTFLGMLKVRGWQIFTLSMS